MQSKDAMVTFFRATVMLTVLVGIPAAWVYYGPLPPEAMGMFQRTVATAKQSIGWSEPAPQTRWTNEAPKTAPRFDAAVANATQTLQQPSTAALPVTPPSPVIHDSQFSLASATVPAAQPPAQVPVDGELARQLEPHLSLLRKLDATEYTLENWGEGGRFYRFCCAVAVGSSEDLTRQFEAIDADPLRAVQQVVGEVTSWQNARRTSGTTRWR